MNVHIEIGDNIRKILDHVVTSKIVDGESGEDIIPHISRIIKEVVAVSSFEDLRKRFHANLEEAFPLGGEEIPKYQAMKAFEDALLEFKK